MRSVAVVVIGIGMGLAACGGNGGTGDDTVGDDTVGDDTVGDDSVGDDTTGDDAPPDVDAPPAASCEGKGALPADDVWTLDHDGAPRTVRVHVPTGYDPSVPTPVVLAFHGYTLNGQVMMDQAHLVDAADAEGFILIAPDGTGALLGWNAGSCCGTAASSGTDDVGLVGAILDRIEADACVDADRVYATGFSNGGFLSHRLGCELADRIAAIAPVSGVIGIPSCAPARPMPVLHVHGTSDLVVAYDNSVFGYLSVEDTIAGWAERDGCPAAAPTEVFAMGDATCVSHTGCAGGAEVQLCTIDGGGHQWPGGTPLPGGGATSTDLDATAAIWAFFAAHPRP